VAVSDDGRFVAFLSAATNLAPGPSSGLTDVYVKDRGAGTVERVSSAPGGAAADGHAFALTIGGDGSTVAFWSRATNLVGGDTNGEDDLFVHHRATDSTQRANIGADGAVTDESLCAFSFDSEFCRRFSHDEAPSLSDDGRVLAFSSLDGEDFGSIVVRDLVAGASTTVTDPAVTFEATAPWVSGDGRFVSYRSGHIVTPGGHILDPVRDGRYVYDREHGGTHEVLPGNALGYDPAVSADRTLRASPTPPYARPRDPARLRLRHRINAGGPEVVTAINTWDADRGFLGGDLLTTARPVGDPAGNGAVYSDARTGIFSYVLPVPDGRYRVRLLFAELRRCCGPFGRVFDVAAEGRVVVDDASLLALSAGQFEQLTIKVPIRVEVFVTVADGVLDLTFTRVVHRPLLSGIEVIDAR